MCLEGPEKRTADGEASGQSALKKGCGESCLPPLPTDFAAHTAIWDDVCLMARALAEATQDNDIMRKSEVLSEEEFYRLRLTRVTNILQTYE